MDIFQLVWKQEIVKYFVSQFWIVYVIDVMYCYLM